jgi:hypothetical protein
LKKNASIFEDESRDMKIYHAVHIYLPEILPGCATSIRDISEILSKTGHQVTVLTAHAITGRGWVAPLFGCLLLKLEPVNVSEEMPERQ